MLDTFLRARMFEALGEALAVEVIAQIITDLGQIVLAVSVRDMG